MRALTKGESAAPIMSWYWPVITLRGAKNREWRRVEEVVAVKAELQEEVAVEEVAVEEDRTGQEECPDGSKPSA